MSACPVYKQAIAAKPWKLSRSANTGLRFDKFADAWDITSWEFNKAHTKNDNEKSWVFAIAKDKPGDGQLLSEACTRQHKLIEAMGGTVVYLKNASRFVTGMGRQHPLENGFTWHHTLGVPYLPGTGVKGVLRAWLREQEDKVKEAWFGEQGEAAKVVFLDMLPTAPAQLAAEVMTPHYGPYYQEKEPPAPGDWHSPVPISYLAVEEGQTWQVGILPAPGTRAISRDDAKNLKEDLLAALDWLGAGAKTATGYGQFREDEEEAKRQEAERQQREQEEAQRREREKAERERAAALRNLPPEVAVLEDLAHKHRWKQDRTALLNGIEEYRKNAPELTEASVAWIRERLEAFWPGIWEEPDAMKGNKPKHNKRGAKIVHWLKGEE